MSLISKSENFPLMPKLHFGLKESIKCIKIKNFQTNTIKVERWDYYQRRENKLTAWFDLSNVVAREPASLGIEGPLPPSAVLLPRDDDHFTLAEGQLVLVVLLEVEAGLHHHLPAAAAIFRHFLFEQLGQFQSPAKLIFPQFQ